MGRTRKENMLAKYLLLKHYRGGPAPAVDWAPMDQWMPDKVDAHMQFMRDFAAGGRHAPAVLPVRAPIPDTGLGRRAHAARGRRPDHESDRTGLPRAGGDHGPANQQGQADRLGCPVQPVRGCPTVLRVLYLVFNEGYSGDVDLAAEAIRLTRQLAAKTNHEEVAGLLALMPLHRARRPARTRTDGSLVRHRAGPQPVGHPPDRRGRRRAPGALARDRLGEFQALLTLLPGRTASVAVQEADIPCTSPHEGMRSVRSMLTTRCTALWDGFMCGRQPADFPRAPGP
jgi:hypothetical protein